MELNDFFSNVVINLKIPKFENFDPFLGNINHYMKVIVKYRKHSIVTAIVSEFTKECFSFNTITMQSSFRNWMESHMKRRQYQIKKT